MHGLSLADLVDADGRGAPQPAFIPALAQLVQQVVTQLRQGWNESGLWGPSAIGIDQIGEAEAVQDALRSRLAQIERMARLAAGSLSADEQDSLDAFCAALVMDD